ncbi:MAG: hypothetical protein OFPII_11050 [Osedax symbiont Rs1]|nr:MAG: hypothetical protein OFPII_11050 [Osedax symbiont Rs1]
MEKVTYEHSLSSLEKGLTNHLTRLGESANYWLSDHPVYLSTKSSGSGEYAQVIEIAILDADLSVLFHSQIQPTVTIDIDAEQLHGINLSSLLERPKWSEVVLQVQQLLIGRQVVVFDGLFETRLLKQSCLAFNLPLDWLDALTINSAMALAVNAYGTDNRYGTVSIEYAMIKANILGFRNDNGAVAATYALFNMLKIIAEFSGLPEPEKQRLAYEIAV